MFGYYSCYVQLQNNVLVTTLKVLVNAAKKRERETIHEMRINNDNGRGKWGILMNSINNSFESFDSCGRAFITILRLCGKPLS